MGRPRPTACPPECPCVHCSLLRCTMDIMYAQLITEGRHDRMPETLIQAFENHTGRDWFNEPTGREPTKELCDYCFYYIRSWIRMTQRQSSLTYNIDYGDSSNDDDSS